MSVAVAAALLALSAGCAARRSAGALRVHAGQPDSRHEFPFIVMFQTRRKPFTRSCSGSLIAPTWVLTAGHCLPDPKKAIIKYGDFHLFPHNETMLYRKIIKTFKHPCRTIITVDTNDIGLVLVEKILNKPTARLLALDYKTLIGLPVQYAGFGLTDEPFDTLPANLSLVPDVRFSPQVGEGIIRPCIGVHNYEVKICVASKCSNRKQIIRSGDSGGPLVYDGQLIGVASAVDYDSVKTAAFSPVSVYMEWIQAVIRSN